MNERNEPHDRSLHRAADGEAADDPETVRRLREQLANADAQIRALAGDLDEFLHLASHDLQEPARHLQAFARLLTLNAAHADQIDLDLVDQIATTSHRFETLTRDLTGLYAQVSGLPARDPVDLDSVVADAADRVSPIVAFEGAVLTTEPLGWVMGDEVLLTRVFENLFKNALAYSGTDPARITVSLHPSFAEAGTVVVGVSDNGIGIPADAADRIFQPFERLAPDGEHAGSGIGLAACRKIITRLGGQIWVESEVGVGSTFYMSLASAVPGDIEVASAVALEEVPPLGSPRFTARRRSSDARPAGVGVDSVRLLLVEDNLVDARLVIGAIAQHRPESFHVEHVTVLGDALERLRVGSFDAILTDLNLPDSKGFSTLEEILDVSGLPVVVLTVIDDGTAGRVAVSRGAQDYIVKNHVALSGIGRTLVHAVERAALEARVADTNAALRTTVSVVSHDIFGPLSTLSGTMGLLAPADPTVMEADLWDLMRRAVDRAIALSSDLRISAQVFEGRVDPHPVVLQVADLFGDALAASGISVGDVEMTGDLELRVFADRGHVSSIIANLLTNAAKYGRTPITLAAETAAGETVLTVSDTGDGVPPEFVGHMFDPLQRSESAKLLAEGSGLGLWIVRSLAEVNGGTVAYDVAGGTPTFRVSLPSSAPG